MIGVVPSVKSIKARPKDEKHDFVRLECVWEYAGNESLVEFHVRWIGDEDNRTRQINKTFDGTDEKVYLYDYEGARQDGDGFIFDKEVC